MLKCICLVINVDAHMVMLISLVCTICLHIKSLSGSQTQILWGGGGEALGHAKLQDRAVRPVRQNNIEIDILPMSQDIEEDERHLAYPRSVVSLCLNLQLRPYGRPRRA